LVFKGGSYLSGHNKWSSIKHKKGAADAKRGKLFSKLVKEITIAARIGGGDLSSNIRLRTAVSTAKSSSMPKENIDRAIKRGTGELEGVNYEEMVYEGYGPGGTAIMVEILTDNKNRAVADVRYIFSKHNGNLGESGCVSWMFDKKGYMTVDKSSITEDELLELALDAGAEDVKEEGDEFGIYTDPSEFDNVKEALENKGIKLNIANVTMIPQNTIELEGKQVAQMLKLMDKLEDSDDVQNVYANFDISDEELERLSV
jgi:YebC/PmpR family DNA-binding regulatory protein